MAGHRPNGKSMTLQQFEALASLIRMRGASREAARLVLVEGASLLSAATATGITVAGVSNAVQRARRAMTLALIAAAQG